MDPREVAARLLALSASGLPLMVGVECDPNGIRAAIANASGWGTYPPNVGPPSGPYPMPPNPGMLPNSGPYPGNPAAAQPGPYTGNAVQPGPYGNPAAANAAQSGPYPAQGPGQSGPSPAQNPGQSGSYPAQNPGQSGPYPAQNPGQSGPYPGQNSGQSGPYPNSAPANAAQSGPYAPPQSNYGAAGGPSGGYPPPGQFPPPARQPGFAPPGNTWGPPGSATWARGDQPPRPPAPPAPERHEGKIGETLRTEGLEGEHIAINLIEVVDPADFLFTAAGYRLRDGERAVVVHTEMTNLGTAPYQTLPDLYLVLVGTDGSTVSKAPVSLSSRPPHRIGVAPGDTAGGHTVYVLPEDTQITAVRWSARPDEDRNSLTWTVD